MGVLMDPSRCKTDSSKNSERKFIVQILWLSLAGGTASFIRVSAVPLYAMPYGPSFIGCGSWQCLVFRTGFSSLRKHGSLVTGVVLLTQLLVVSIV